MATSRKPRSTIKGKTPAIRTESEISLSKGSRLKIAAVIPDRISITDATITTSFMVS
jgi:hypothetical protein